MRNNQIRSASLRLGVLATLTWLLAALLTGAVATQNSPARYAVTIDFNWQPDA